MEKKRITKKEEQEAVKQWLNAKYDKCVSLEDIRRNQEQLNEITQGYFDRADKAINELLFEVKAGLAKNYVDCLTDEELEERARNMYYQLIGLHGIYDCLEQALIDRKNRTIKQIKRIQKESRGSRTRQSLQ